MVEHEALQFAVISSTPELALEERPADLHFALGWFQVPIARAADDASGGTLDDGEGAAGLDATIEISLEDFRLVAVALRVLLPNERVARRRKQFVKIFAPQRT